MNTLPYWNDLPLLCSTALFMGFSLGDVQDFAKAFPPFLRKFAKGEIILSAGYENHEIGILLSGEAHALKESLGGESFIAAQVLCGGVIGDVLSGGNTKSPVTVQAAQPCKILFFSYPALLAADEEHSVLLRRFYANFTAILSDKYFALHRRIDLLLIKSLRQKLSAYLLGYADTVGTNNFTIPFTRVALSAYLGCERSALSRELSRMAADGLLQTQRRSFVLLRPDVLRELL